ncbi:MAG: acetylornithine deacetylase, partial [Alphaproteobacteria bacterium]|nr:acetylornithine deacetylase [Alphaproteobacteria bacterium]
MSSKETLARLIAFDTVSRNSNLSLMDFVSARLRDAGVEPRMFPSEDGAKANLFATVGATDVPGVMLSGHTDVVPIDGQEWTRPAFEMTEEGGKLYGRGSCDMKGFVACALTAAERAAELHRRGKLKTPLHLAFSYDEEVGCIGVQGMIKTLAGEGVRPLFCIVGEPSEMRIATGHKGKVTFAARCIGREAHSALVTSGVNAIYLASELVGEVRRIQEEIIRDSRHDGDYAVPYSTMHVGTFNGGVALNIVPNFAEVVFECRNIAEEDTDAVIAKVRDAAERISAGVRGEFPEAGVEIEVRGEVPALGTAVDSEVVEFVKKVTGANDTTKVSYGTEAGLFSRDMGVPTVICGPGCMDQGHKPDEFVTVEQLNLCDAMMDS